MWLLSAFLPLLSLYLIDVAGCVRVHVQMPAGVYITSMRGIRRGELQVPLCTNALARLAYMRLLSALEQQTCRLALCISSLLHFADSAYGEAAAFACTNSFRVGSKGLSLAAMVFEKLISDRATTS
jgi:hypothetical protein